MCSNLFTAHILTGSDTTSKIGTKAAAIKCGQIDYLNNFGLEYSIKSQFESAEKYLVAVLQKNSKFQPLTIITKRSILDVATVLDPPLELLDPVMYGWKSTHDDFLPEKREKEMPEEYTMTCNCKIRCTVRCKYVKNDVFCTIF